MTPRTRPGGIPARYPLYCPRCDVLVPKGAPIEKRGGEWVCIRCWKEGRE